MVASAKEEKSDKIVIENIGPIERLEFAPKPGTITVFRGRNGAGKSTALNAINGIALNGSQRLTSRDGTVGGKVEGFGATLKIARNGANRRMGDVEVEAIEDQYNIADLVDPQIKDPAAADAKRIRALVSLAGVAADIETFRGLFGSTEQFDSVVKPSSLKSTDDVIQLADAIKRDVEAAARTIEAKCESEWSQIQSLRSQAGEPPAEMIIDEEQLKQKLEAATLRKAELNNQRDVYVKISSEVSQIRMQKQLYEEEGLPSVADEQEALDALMSQYTELEAEERRLEAAMMAARDALQAGRIALDNHRAKIGVQDARFKSAVDRQNALNTMNASIDRLNQLPNPSNLEIVEAGKEVDLIHEQLNQLAQEKKAAELRAQAAAREEALAVLRDKASALRQLSQRIPTVLADAVRSLKSSVDVTSDFRLIVNHEKRGQVFFAELSHGERWALALSLFLQAVEKNEQPAILAIPQEAWEGLDAYNKKLIADIVAQTQLMVFTAECTQIFSDKEADVIVNRFV